MTVFGVRTKNALRISYETTHLMKKFQMQPSESHLPPFLPLTQPLINPHRHQLHPHTKINVSMNTLLQLSPEPSNKNNVEIL